ncbi:MAG: glycosyl hydrolase [Candidatus Hinthialibacter antarcticus]|nr:glycosyl hydrolase [Candidatus Hinthialibacter antarcticus]
MKVLFTTFFSILITASALFTHANPGDVKITSLKQALEHFADPPAAYRPAPLYTWNGDMEEKELALQLDEFKAGGFGGVFVHPRPGLITPYLSDRWLEMWRFTADESAKRGMVTYIYDENSYPSGFAGGHVPDEIPGSGQVSLRRQDISAEQIKTLELNSTAIALYKIADKKTGAYQRVELPTIPKGETLSAADLNLAEGDYILYTEQYPGPSPWYGGKTYVDVMRPDVSKRFLDLTFDAYDSVLSDLYGKTVLASFTDEPQVAGAWSSMVPPAFQARWGYNILDCLPSIHSDVGDWRKVRHDYSATILQLFIDNFVEPYSKACAERGIALTGHVWEHGWPHLNHNPDIMSFYRWQQWPGIDCLMNEYSESANAQFGNYRANKELDSIANQLGRTRRLCETYGAGGWDLRLEDVKRIGDHLFAGGVNLMNPHLSYYTIMGARKRDHPQSFSYHQPFWDAFHIPMDYFGRLSWALSAGKADAPILVIEPTVTMWMYNWSGSQGEKLNHLGAEFQSYVTELGAKQIAFDLGSEPVMAEIAKAQGKQLIVGQCAYDVVVLPPGLEALETSTIELLKTFAANGGTIVSYVGVPTYEGGTKSDAAQEIKKHAGDNWTDEKLTAEQLAQRWGNAGVVIDADAPEAGRVFHFARDLDDGKLVFLINTSLEDSSKGSATINGAYAEHWNAVTGKIETADYTKDGGAVSFDFNLPPAGSALFAVYNNKPNHQTVAPQTWQEKSKPLTPSGEMRIARQDANVLTLDYVNYEVNGSKQQGAYFYDAQTAVYKAHGFDKNPWDNAVQFKDEILKRDHFPADSGFEFQYPFTIEGFNDMPALEFVVERGGFYTVTINNHVVKPNPGEWRIDRAFTVYSIKPEWLKNGENIITTAAKPFSLHMEAEPAYLFGEFNLKSVENGYAVTPPQPLQPGAWNQQGAPFYSDAVAYEQTYTLGANDKSQHYVELPNWLGTAVRVEVNGKAVGNILWQPYRLDITDALQRGENTVSVVVMGSLKNLLGPHHAGQMRGRAWPSAFHQNPKGGQPAGEQYDTIGYGLFEPFVVY